jgi:hypothetical protein
MKIIRMLYLAPLSHSKHAGLRRKLENLQALMLNHDVQMDVQFFKNRIFGREVYFYCRPPKHLVDYDVVIVRATLFSKKWKKMGISGILIGERHIAKSKRENFKDIVRVLWEKFYFDPRKMFNVIIYPTEELRLEDECYGLKQYVMGNPTTFTRGQIEKASNNNMGKNEGICMIIGSENKWQGLERFSELANVLPHMAFVVLSNSRVKIKNAPNNLIVKVLQSDEMYLNELSGIRIGFSSLALERKKLSEAASLKMRDLISFNKPIVAIHDDHQINLESTKGILKFNDWESLIENNIKVADFYEASIRHSYSQDLRNLVSLEYYASKLVKIIRIEIEG